MNQQEQRNHKRVTDAIANDVASIAEATADRLDDLQSQIREVADEARKAVGNECTHRLALAKEQRAYVDRQDLIIENQIRALRDRGFWGRMKWIVRGI